MMARWIVACAVLAAALVAATPAGAFFLQPIDLPLSGTNGIVLGPDGNVWVAEEFSDSVLHMSTDGTLILRYRFDAGSHPTTVAAGPGGRVWVTLRGAVGVPGRIVWFDATAPQPIAHPAPAFVSDCGPAAIVAGNDGFMYFSLPGTRDGTIPCNNGVGQLGKTPEDGGGLVTLAPAGGGTVFDLVVAGGRLFAPDFDGDVIRRVVPSTLTPEAAVRIPTAGGAPHGVAADQAGNIWVTEYNAGTVARFPANAPDNSEAVEFAPLGAPLTTPFGIVAGADGRMYMAATNDAGSGTSAIARVNADGSGFTVFPAGDAEPFRIINGTDGDLLVTDRLKTRILRFVNTAPRVTTNAAAATAPTSGAATAGVNPRGNETQLVFDYGPTAAYGFTSAPVTLPTGVNTVAATAPLTGLAPSTTYHLRARATNAEGSATGADLTFVTPAGLVDADKDGVSPPADCNDANPAIRPGAVDVPGDGIDQDCSGRDAVFPELTATTTFVYRARATSTVVSRIDISRLQGGETARIGCTGKRCPFKVRTFKLKKGKRSFGPKLLRRRGLRAGTRLSVRVTKPQTIGTSTVLTVRRGKAPRIVRACLQPGATKSSACP